MSPGDDQPVVVREAVTTAEIDAAGRVVAAAYRAIGFTRQSYLDQLGDASDRAATAHLLVAVDPGGQVLGSVTFTVAGQPYAEVSRPGEAEFRMLGVDPAAGGRGVGLALIQGCITAAREAGASALAICTTERMVAARTLYERLGFVRDPERDWQPNADVDLLGYVLALS